MGVGQIERKERIRRLLEDSNTVSVGVLARRLGTSGATIRRDLAELEEEGVVMRTYGGAVRHGIPPGFTYDLKESANTARKRCIAERAASFIERDDTIFLDSGTTTLEIARILRKRGFRGVVVTTSLPVADELAGSNEIRVYVVGGFLRPELRDFHGPSSAEQIRTLAIGRAFLGVDSLSADAGLATTDAGTVEIEKAVIGVSRWVCVVADSSKVGRSALIPYAKVSDVDALITDEAADHKAVAALERAGVMVVTVRPSTRRRSA